MSVLSPIYLWAAAGMAAVVVGLHFITTRPGRPSVFPTVRFVPQAPLRAMQRVLKFSDLALLLWRVLAILLIGLAFAQPHWTPDPQGQARIVAVDLSARVARSDAWRETVQQAMRGAVARVVFDDQAREVSEETLTMLLSTDAPTPSGASDEDGAVSAALIVARRIAQRLSGKAETVHLTMISPFARRTVDAATPAIRALWSGPIETVQVARAQRPEHTPAAQKPSVYWSQSTASPYWRPRAQPDQVGGVYSEAATLIAPFERRWQLMVPQDKDVEVIAWWLDGEPAAIELTEAGIRQRWMGFSLPQDGDIALRPTFARFQAWLNGADAVEGDGGVLTEGELNQLFNAPAQRSASAWSERASTPSQPIEAATQVTALMAGLLAAALCLVLLEIGARGWLTRVRTDVGGSA